jgi:bile acid:Na+ symporter, BASS family
MPMQSSLALSLGLPVALCIIMLGLGLALTLEDFLRVLSRPKPVVVGLACQLVLLPAFCFALVAFLGFPQAIAVGMVLLAASPGGTSATLFTHLAHGDVALSITLAATSSLIAMLSLPITANLSLLFFYGEAEPVYLEILDVLQIFSIAILPAMTGVFIRSRYRSAALRLERPVRIVATLFLLAVVLFALISQWRLVPVWGPTVGAAALVFNLVSLAVGFHVPRIFGIERRQAIAIAMSISIHNAALVIALALSESMLDSPEMAIPPAAYGLLAYVTAGVMVWILNRQPQHRSALAETRL